MDLDLFQGTLMVVEDVYCIPPCLRRMLVGAKVMVDLLPNLVGVLDEGIKNAILITYSDCLGRHEHGMSTSLVEPLGSISQGIV
jgi:hypothetical protein